MWTAILTLLKPYWQQIAIATLAFTVLTGAYIWIYKDGENACENRYKEAIAKQEKLNQQKMEEQNVQLSNLRAENAEYQANIADLQDAGIDAISNSLHTEASNNMPQTSSNTTGITSSDKCQQQVLFRSDKTAIKALASCSQSLYECGKIIRLDREVINAK